jgi:hypothetical protein
MARRSVATETAADGAEPTTPPEPEVDGAEAVPTVGPPFFLLGIGALSSLVSLALVVVDSAGVHALGYLCGTLVPIVAIGLFRRSDLSRRKSAAYRLGELKSWMIPAVLVVGLVAAALHIWALATQLAS